MAEKKKAIHAGHRQRMREEFLARGLEGWPDHRALELLLFHSIPQGDVNPLAHTLIDRFGSLAGVLHATYEQLLSVKGVGPVTAALIALVPAMGGRYLQERTDLNGIYQTSWQFRELLEPEFFGARNERVYMACLDAKYKLIATFKLGEGIADAASITTRKVMETALACNASIVVLAHNHVSGLALPSAEDVSTTLHLRRSLKQVGILLHDHLIFVEGDMTSMRESGYLED
ncbi:MAG: DNA repair protein RadC [Roseburia sp.]|nr:DNA repair protein RadC [Roseburia sp.]